MIKILRYFDSKWNSFLLFIRGLSCFLSCLLITADVLGRYFFKAPIPGALESTELMLCIIVFGPLAYLEARGEHVRILFVHSKLSARCQLGFNLFAKVLGIVFFSTMTWQTWVSARYSFIIGEVSWGQVPFPLWIGKTFIPLGTLSLTLYLLGSVVLDLFGHERRNITEK